MRVLPAHLAFIFVAQEYLNSAESKNGFVVLGPGGRDVAHRTRNSQCNDDFLLPCIPHATYQRLLVGTCVYYFSSLKGVHLIGLAFARGLVVVVLVYPKVGAVLLLFWKSHGHPDFWGCRGWVCRQGVTDAPPREEQQLPKRQVGKRDGALLIACG